jgi:hypothetical protein
LDATKVFILVIDLQFLGMGRVRVGFDIDGQIVYAHEFLNANNLITPYMQSGTLPVGMLLTATSTGSTKTCYFKCAVVQSEGGNITEYGYAFSTPEATVTAASGARTHLLSIRPKTTFNSIVNRELFRLNRMNILVTGNNPVLWELLIGATFSVAPTYADVNTTNSAFEYGTGGTYTAASGYCVASGYVAANNQNIGSANPQITAHYPISLDRSGAVRANGTLSLVVSGIGSTSATRATMEFLEIR